jgi:hypothetical protein
MAALAADIEIKYDPRWDIGLIQRPATAADTYYRGGLAHSTIADATLNLVPAAVDYYAGVVMEHKVVAAAAELVWIGTAGRFFFTCANITAANVNETVAQQAAVLFDNPADLDVTGVGDAGAVGTIWMVGTTGTDGWVDTDNRAVITNA